jgi:molybdate/tungstate transport system ATP-binding protein
VSLRLENITKRLGSFRLPAMDLELRPGEYFVLLGPSGVGKTVLLELIAGLIQPDDGRLFWNGNDITHTSPEKRGFGMVYQDYALFPHLSVRSNLLYGPRSRGLRGEKIDKRFNDLADKLDLAPILKRTPVNLSGGERQRVALARALIVEPELLLLDEPLSAIDSRFRRKLRAELKRLHSETGTTFLHVTHDVEEAISLGQRIGVMLDGKLKCVTTPEVLFHRPTDVEVADFIGIRNVLPIDSVEGDLVTVNGVELHCVNVREDCSHIWILPEEIILSTRPFESSARNTLECVVEGWDHLDILIAVHLRTGDLRLTALVTFVSFNELKIIDGQPLLATFKSSAVHCF